MKISLPPPAGEPPAAGMTFRAAGMTFRAAGMTPRAAGMTPRAAGRWKSSGNILDWRKLNSDADLTKTLYKRAFALAIFTIAYNIVEGIVSTWFGAADDSLTLFGFGVDSFIEAVSGLGIAHMVVRIGEHQGAPPDRFEKTALRVTGYSFYALAAGLSATVVFNIISGHRPESTLPGVIISVISIAVMLWLIRAKTRVGRELSSPAIIADASCTKVCVYMSLVLLAASAAYELTGFAHVDNIGAAALGYLSFTEGRECFEKAASDEPCGCSTD